MRKARYQLFMNFRGEWRRRYFVGNRLVDASSLRFANHADYVKRSIRFNYEGR